MQDKVFRSILSMVLCIAFLFSLSFSFVSYAASQTGSINMDYVRVRTGAGTNYSTLTYGGSNVLLSTGYSVTVTETVKSTSDTTNLTWCHISFTYLNKKMEGYVASQFVTISKETTTATTTTATTITKQSTTTTTTTSSSSSTTASSTDLTGIPKEYKSYISKLLTSHPKWKFVIYNTGLEWDSLFGTNAEGYVGRSLIPSTYPLSWRSTAAGCYNWRTDKWIAQDSSSWYQANTETIAYYMDPRNFLNENYVFMFESLSFDSSTQTLAGVNKILSGSFMDGKSIKDTNNKSLTYAQTYIKAATTSNVSPYHLASRTIQEVGKNGSGSTSGTYNGYEGYYNFYNIGATQGTSPIANGLSYAKGVGVSEANKTKYMLPWNSQYKAIVGGAIWIGNGYINSVNKQNTIYFQKFNTSGGNFGHQYMGNIVAPLTESKSVLSTYSSMGILDSAFTFIVPYYKNMPSSACQLPEKNNLNPNNYLYALYVYNGSTDLVSGFDPAVTTWDLGTVSSSTTKLNINATPVNSAATVSGTGNVSLETGENSFNITVKAANGNKRVYTVKVNRSKSSSVALKSIALSSSDISLYKGDSKTLTVSYNPTSTTVDKTVTWISSNTKVAKVSNGKITAVAAGTATITATVGSCSATCKVKVSEKAVKGDVDADGVITISDALMIFKYKSSEISFDSIAMTAADTDGNGKIEIVDALRIFKYKSGEISSL